MITLQPGMAEVIRHLDEVCGNRWSHTVSLDRLKMSSASHCLLAQTALRNQIVGHSGTDAQTYNAYLCEHGFSNAATTALANYDNDWIKYISDRRSGHSVPSAETPIPQTDVFSADHLLDLADILTQADGERLSAYLLDWRDDVNLHNFDLQKS